MGNHPSHLLLVGGNMKANLLLGVLLLSILGCQRPTTLSGVNEVPQGWVSSGGEIFDDSQNPWFLDDGKPIPYCIQVDSSSFTASAGEVSRLVKLSLEYWKSEFKSNAESGVAMIAPPLDRFVETTCDGGEALRFQMGYGTLSEEQARFLGTKAPHVSLAVRTAYDRVKLRGRGFVYVASDSGEARHPKGSEYVDKHWQYSGLLWRILTHEIGHVLGIPHFGHGLMSAFYPERILTKEIYLGHLSEKHLGSVLRIPEKYLNCTMKGTEVARKWFNFPQDADCLVIQLDTEIKDQMKVNFFAAHLKDPAVTALGQAEMPKDSTNFHMGLDGFASLFLPPEQTALTLPADHKYKILFFLLSMDVGLTYRPVGSLEVRELYLKLQPDAYQLLIRHDGQIRSVLSHRENCISVPFGHICAGL